MESTLFYKDIHMKNMNFFLLCFAISMVAQQEIAALQTKFAAKSAFNAFHDGDNCDGSCSTSTKDDDSDSDED